MSGVILWIPPLIVFLASAWLALLVAAPLLPAAPAALTYVVGALLCHQLPDRSFHLGGFQLPVCARCLGIYAGFAGGVLAALSRPVPGSDPRAGRRWGLTPWAARLMVGIGVAPTALTVSAEWLGLWQPANATRFAAGLPLGLAIGLVVMAALHYGECARRPPIRSPRPPSPI